jgi:hypothetical protein
MREWSPLLGAPIMMEKKLQPESKIKLFGCLNSHHTQKETQRQCFNKQVELFVTYNSHQTSFVTTDA